MSTSTKESDRKRAPNFTSREKILLLNIIHIYKNIIENKKTNATTWREKDMAWSKVAQTFNSQNEEAYYRTNENLKKYYENIKKTVRKDVAEEKKELYKTGGGIFIPKNDPVKDLTLDLINKNTVYGFHDSFGGDSDVQGTNDAVFVMEVEQDTSKEIQEEHYNEDLSKAVDDHTYTHEESGKSVQNELLQAPSTSRDSSTNLVGNLSPKKLVQGFSGHISQPKTPSLQHTWTKRRRPTPQVDSSSELNKQYIETAITKQKCYEAELINIETRRQQEKELFELQKEKIQLEIEIKKQELKKLLK